MLKLVHKRKETKKEEIQFKKTCKKSCTLYNDKLQTCPMFKGLDYNDPNIVKRCLEFTDREETESLYNEEDNISILSLIEEQTEEGDLGFQFEVSGRNRMNSDDLYPLQPNGVRHNPEHFYWFVSPDQTYGCWIKKQNNNTVYSIPSNRESAQKGWADNIYKSPIPLHDHKASESLQSRMCWFVDNEGWGQYTVIIANDISFLTFPKPPNWEDKKRK